MGNSSAERAAQSRSPGAGAARQGAARARRRAIMLTGDRAATEYRGRAEARLGRRREPLHASRGRGGGGRGGRGSGGARAQRRGAPALALGGGRGRALHASNRGLGTLGTASDGQAEGNFDNLLESPQLVRSTGL